jgi:hypothetical protein
MICSVAVLFSSLRTLHFNSSNSRLPIVIPGLSMKAMAPPTSPHQVIPVIVMMTVVVVLLYQ